jgi:hypothetical protein
MVRPTPRRKRLRGAWHNVRFAPKQLVPSNRNEPICFSPYLYQARDLVEFFFNKIKQCRRIAMCYDKLAANYLAFVQLASIRLWLRGNVSTPSWANLCLGSLSPRGMEERPNYRVCLEAGVARQLQRKGFGASPGTECRERSVSCV